MVLLIFNIFSINLNYINYETVCIFVDFANYFGNYLTYYREDGMTNASSLYSYITALYNGGYFTADFNSYYNSVLQVFNTINF